MRLVSYAAELVIRAFERNPGSWTPGRYHVDHVSGIMIWTANGYWFVQPYEHDRGALPTFGLIDKWFVWRAYKRWLRNHGSHVIQKLKEESERKVVKNLSVVK